MNLSGDYLGAQRIVHGQGVAIGIVAMVCVSVEQSVAFTLIQQREEVALASGLGRRGRQRRVTDEGEHGSLLEECLYKSVCRRRLKRRFRQEQADERQELFEQTVWEFAHASQPAQIR